jgi:membrane dipeptidase
MKRLFWVVGILAVVVVGAALWAPSIVEGRYNRVRIRSPYAIPAEAANLQKKLFVADLHADTLLWGRNLLTRTTRGHLDLPRLQQANVSLQFFTVVTTIPGNLNIESNKGSSDLVRYLAIAEGWPPRTWNSPKERALYQAGRLRKFESDSHGVLVILRTRSDLEQFVASPTLLRERFFIPPESWASSMWLWARTLTVPQPRPLTRREFR